MTLTGKSILGYQNSLEGNAQIKAINPKNNEILKPLYFKTTQKELNRAVELASIAFEEYKGITPETRANFLDKIAEEIENLGDKLLQRYVLETALPEGRAAGERGRTCGQLRLFAELLREGSWVNARIDTALPERTPPRVDLRSMEVPIGPIGVFGASNFPLAFSVAGGDTAAALAAGCPVVFKAHQGHLGTSEMVGNAIQKAAKQLRLPDGVFSLLFDDGIEIGQSLVKHEKIKAIAFTGSFKGGKAIFDTANQREEPIPVYAEMGSSNPVFLLSTSNLNDFADSFLASVNLGVGQFCTNPGILVIEKNDELISLLESKVKELGGGTMLQEHIAKNYNSKIDQLKQDNILIGEGKKEKENCSASAILFKVTAEEFLKNANLEEEIFGPASVIVQCENKQQFETIAKNLNGHLTGTIHGSETDLKANKAFVNALTQKVGRILINGFPTGVEVSNAMVHGGPFPATTNARTTSVGTLAIHRFTRPVCFQNFPDTILPDALKESNPLKINRLYNNKLSKK